MKAWLIIRTDSDETSEVEAVYSCQESAKKAFDTAEAIANCVRYRNGSREIQEHELRSL